MKRREFLTKGLVLTGLVFFAKKDAIFVWERFPNGLIYTKNEPGIWGTKIASHVPFSKNERKCDNCFYKSSYE